MYGVSFALIAKRRTMIYVYRDIALIFCLTGENG